VGSTDPAARTPRDRTSTTNACTATSPRRSSRCTSSASLRQRGPAPGFLCDERHAVTNAHVVSDSPEVELRLSDGSWRVGRVVGTDRYTDLAVVEVDDLPDAVRPLPVATANPSPGRPVAALGNPLGLGGSITPGIVSGANRSMSTPSGFAIPDVVRTDAPIDPGNSGGRSLRSWAVTRRTARPGLGTTGTGAARAAGTVGATTPVTTTMAKPRSRSAERDATPPLDPRTFSRRERPSRGVTLVELGGPTTAPLQTGIEPFVPVVAVAALLVASRHRGSTDPEIGSDRTLSRSAPPED